MKIAGNHSELKDTLSVICLVIFRNSSTLIDFPKDVVAIKLSIVKGMLEFSSYCKSFLKLYVTKFGVLSFEKKYEQIKNFFELITRKLSHH